MAKDAVNTAPEQNHKTEPKWLQYIEYLGFRVLMGFISIMPLSVNYAVAYVVAWVFYHLDFYHRNRAITHIFHSGILNDRKKAKELVFAYFWHVGKVIVETIKARQVITPVNFREYIELEADDDIKHRFFNEDGASEQAILVSGHLGNWELAGMAYTLFSGKRLLTIVRPYENVYIRQFIFKIRETDKHGTVSKKQGIRPLLEAINNGNSIAIIADQHASRREGIEITSFNHPARAHRSPSHLALHCHCPILVGALIRKDDRLHYKLVVSGIIEDFKNTGEREEDIRRVTQCYNDYLEKLIRQYPEQWLWAHRRWLDCNRKHSGKAR